MNDNISEILPGKLYLGNRVGAREVPSTPFFASKEGHIMDEPVRITHVLNATLEVPSFYQFVPSPYAFDDKETIRYCTLPMIDLPLFPLKNYIDEASQFIHESIQSGGVVFVHCFEGKSRSVSCIIAYLMEHKLMSLEEALQFVQSRREIANPNFGFRYQLLKWGNKKLGLQ